MTIYLSISIWIYSVFYRAWKYMKMEKRISHQKHHFGAESGMCKEQVAPPSMARPPQWQWSPPPKY
jgi:hypothetical protein